MLKKSLPSKTVMRTSQIRPPPGTSTDSDERYKFFDELIDRLDGDREEIIYGGVNEALHLVMIDPFLLEEALSSSLDFGLREQVSHSVSSLLRYGSENFRLISPCLEELSVKTHKLSTNTYADTFYSSSSKKGKLFVLKSAHKPRLLGHEYIIGKHVINNLREFVPNFVYTYSLLKCTAPDTQFPSGEGVSNTYPHSNYPASSTKYRAAKWCTEGNDKPHSLLLESILGESLQDFIAKRERLCFPQVQSSCEERVLPLVFLQIFSAISLAQAKYEFNHGDLHGRNIIVKTLPQPVYVPIYNGNKLLGHIRTIYIPLIIDFGLSCALVENTRVQNLYENIVDVDGWSSKALNPFHDFCYLFDKLVSFHPRSKVIQKIREKVFLPHGNTSLAKMGHIVISDKFSTNVITKDKKQVENFLTSYINTFGLADKIVSNVRVQEQWDRESFSAFFKRKDDYPLSYFEIAGYLESGGFIDSISEFNARNNTLRTQEKEKMREIVKRFFVRDIKQANYKQDVSFLRRRDEDDLYITETWLKAQDRLDEANIVTVHSRELTENIPRMRDTLNKRVVLYDDLYKKLPKQ